MQVLHQSTDELVREHLAATEAVRKKILKSKKSTNEFLMRIGYLDKEGKRAEPQDVI